MSTTPMLCMSFIFRKIYFTIRKYDEGLQERRPQEQPSPEAEQPRSGVPVRDVEGVRTSPTKRLPGPTERTGSRTEGEAEGPAYGEEQQGERSLVDGR